MKKQICDTTERFISDYQRSLSKPYWRNPIIGFASARDTLFAKLKKVVSETHFLPTDLLPEAETIVAFFVPFERWIVSSNMEGETASLEWAEAYITTNKMISELCEHMKEYLRIQGYQSTTVPPTHNFDSKKLISNWSHRHVAYIAGLGTFGLNNMLITENGCCGRIGSFVTSAVIFPDKRKEKEFCLYKSYSSCKKCITKCVRNILSEDGFDRFSCYESCLENAKLYSSLGKADVCGKCLIGLPCSLKNPIKH